MNNASAESSLWNHFFSIRDSHDYVFTVAAGALTIALALPLNGYVLVLILTGTRETLASDFFSLNLAISEIILLIFIFCYFASVALNCLACFEAYMFSPGFMYTGRPLFQSLICVDCYIGVVHPVLFLRYKPLRYRVACCCVVWLIILVFCIYSVFTFSEPLYLYGFVTQNMLYLSVMLFCCIAVARALKQPGPAENATEKRKKKKSNTVKRKAFKIILLIMTSNTISSLFYMLAVPTQCCLDPKDFRRALTICIAVALTAGFMQPLLYLQRNRKLICCKKL